MYFQLGWVFIALHGLCLAAVTGATLLCCAGFSFGGYSCCGAWALGAWELGAGAHKLSSCGLWDLEPRLRSCGTQA